MTEAHSRCVCPCAEEGLERREARNTGEIVKVLDSHAQVFEYNMKYNDGLGRVFRRHLT